MDAITARLRRYDSEDYRLLVKALRVIYRRLVKVEKQVAVSRDAARSANNTLRKIRHDRKHYWTKRKLARALARRARRNEAYGETTDVPQVW